MRFVCDVMLGRLAKYLRILGFDAVYVKGGASLEHYVREGGDRVFLTRRTGTTHFARTIHIRSDAVREQLKEIRDLIRPCLKRENVFGRCVECNTELVKVDKEEIESLVPEFVYHNYARFKRCPSCNRVYWEGSHTTGMSALLEEVLA
jgi:uncharacterized protein with PIN domain